MNSELIERIRSSARSDARYLFADAETYSVLIDYYVDTYYDAVEKDRVAIKNIMKNSEYQNELELYKLKVIRVIDKLKEGFIVA